MSQIAKLESQIDEALERLKSALQARDARKSAPPETPGLAERMAEVETENASLSDELERLRMKRDKDVAALDDLILQLKPLIAEA